MTIPFAISITAFVIYLVLGIVFSGLKKDGIQIPWVLSAGVVISFFTSIITFIIGVWSLV